MNRNGWLLLALVFVGAVTGGLLVEAGVDDGGKASLSVTVGGKKETTLPPKQAEVFKDTVATQQRMAAQDDATHDPTPEAHDDLGSPVPGPSEIPSKAMPEGKDPEKLAETIKENEALPTKPDKDLPEPLATPDPPGGGNYYTASVRNKSARGGCTIKGATYHFTVSDNRPGPGDGWAIVKYFDLLSTRASSTTVSDADGNVWRLMGDQDKPWTQGWFNCWMVSNESVGRGLKSDWTDKHIRNLAWLGAQWSRRWGFPIRRGATKGCEITRTGFFDHNQLGCNNTHTDVEPNFPWPLFLRYAAMYAGTGPGTLGTVAQRTACRKLTWWRRTREAGQARRNAVLRRTTLRRRGYSCKAGKLARVA